MYFHHIITMMIISTCFLGGCRKSEQELDLSVHVKTHLGEPIAGASVTWDQEFLGETDGRGYLKAQRKKRVNVGTKILIKKDSPSHSFSEFSKNLLIEDRQVTNGAAPLILEATLFYVPKGNQEDVDNHAGQDMPKAEKNNEDAHQTSLPKEPSTNNPQLSEANSSKIDKPMKIEKAPRPDPKKEKEPLSSLPPLVGHKEVKKENQQERAEIADLPSRRPTIKIIPVEPIEPQVKESEEISKTNGYFKDSILTVHLSERRMVNKKNAPHLEAPIAQGKVRVFRKDLATAIASCVTNDRGRCVLKFSHPLDEPILVLANKTGYLTANIKHFIKPQSILKLSMKHGSSFDLFTYQKTYSRQRSLHGIRMIINGKFMGQTNEFGFSSVPWTHLPEELTTVSLQDPQGKEVIFEGDFSTPPKSGLTKFLSPNQDLRARLALLPPSVHMPSSKSASNIISRAIEQGLSEGLFKSKIFQEYPMSLVQKRMIERNLVPHDIVNQGFEILDLASTLDGVVFSELRPKEMLKSRSPDKGPWELEIRVFNRWGQVIAGSFKELTDLDLIKEEGQMPRALDALKSAVVQNALYMNESWPFQGKITQVQSLASSKEIVGKLEAQALQVLKLNKEREISIYGYQPSLTGDEHLWTKIGQGRVIHIGDDSIKASLDWQAPRTIVQNGDLFQIDPNKVMGIKSTSRTPEYAFRVYSENHQKHLTLDGAHLYADGRWVAQSDKNGNIIVYNKLFSTASSFFMTKSGYKSKEFEPKPLVTHDKSIDHEEIEKKYAFQRIELSPQLLLISIDSTPQNADVFINGKALGRTPLETYINREDLLTDIHLKLKLGSGFKDVQKSMGIPDQAIRFTGDQRIVFEEDILNKADRLVLSGRTHQALDELSKISSSHSDYFQAMIRAGDLSLKVLDDPEKAIGFYDRALLRGDEGVMSSQMVQLNTQRLMAIVGIYEQRKQSTLESNIKIYQEKIAENLSILAHASDLSPEEKKSLTLTNHFLDAWTMHLLASFKNDVVSKFQSQKKWRAFLSGLAELDKKGSLSQDPALLELKSKSERFLLKMSELALPINSKKFEKAEL